MRSITLNIGRDLGPNADPMLRAKFQSLRLPEYYVLGKVAQLFGNVQWWADHVSDTEPTMVVEVNIGGLAERCGMLVNDDIGTAGLLISMLADRLGQEAIAWHDGLNGHMSGPMADKWGPFNGQFFICMDGEKLVDADGKERVDHWYAQ